MNKAAMARHIEAVRDAIKDDIADDPSLLMDAIESKSPKELREYFCSFLRVAWVIDNYSYESEESLNARDRIAGLLRNATEDYIEAVFHTKEAELRQEAADREAERMMEERA